MADLGKTPPASEITPERLASGRREFLKNSLLFTATAAGVGTGLLALTHAWRRGRPPAPAGALEFRPGSFGTTEAQTPLADVTSYNNFYEFGGSKDDPSREAGSLRTRPWTVAVGGEVLKPRELDADDLRRLFPLEERVYRMRCVEAWSMVIPWLGFPLASLLREVQPTSDARYVAFTTLLDPAQMPGERYPLLDWPYTEGLRLDEAMHPLTLLAVGLYGRPLPNQNGAPVRLVVPWKYGFKGIKSIVKITLTREQPPTVWNLAAPQEYGFYANVNPAVDHPRWSQATERRIGEVARRPTLPFNGYAEQVAGLYGGMDLKRFYGNVAARRSWLKPAVFAGALAPLAAILWNAAHKNLGANPIAEALNELGLTALVLLVASLACTPLREVLDWSWAIALRRMLGLFAFFYACLHFATYAVLDQGLALRAIFADVTKRPFIIAGFAAFLCLVPLAATSTAASVRRLGFPRWKRLHRLAYVAGGLAVVHFVLRVKKDVREPAVYGVVLGVLLLARLILVLRRRLLQARAPAA